MFAALNPIALQLGGLEVHWYGIIIASGVLLAVYLAIQEAKRRDVSEDHILNLVLWSLPFALIGARTYYVAFEWQYYSQHPAQIIAIWHGGIAIYGALIASAIVFIVYCHAKDLSIWLILDIAAPTVMIAQAIGRWGNFMNQEAFGGITTRTFLAGLHIPNWIIQQMFIGGAYRQPTFLYESTWNVIGFVILMLIRHRHHLFQQGEVFLSYAMWYSFGRFFVEGMRTDSLYITSTLRVSQLVSVIVFVSAIIIWVYRRYRSATPWYMAGNLNAAINNKE